MKVQIQNIRVGKRVRKDLGDLETLKKSIEKHGLLHPILISPGGELITGYRRLSAALLLGWKEIEANIINPGKELDILELEMEENMARKDFTFEELMDGLEKKKKLLRPNFFLRIWNFFRNFMKALFRI